MVLVNARPMRQVLAENTECGDHDYQQYQQPHGPERLARHRVDTAAQKFIHFFLVLGVKAVVEAAIRLVCVFHSHICHCITKNKKGERQSPFSP